MYNLTILRAISEGASEEAINEMTKMDKYKLYNSDEAKDLSAKLREARAEDDEKKQQKLYKEALEMAQALKKKAAKIDNNDFLDWAVDIAIKPWWWFIADLALAGSSKNNEGLTGLSRQQAMDHFDALIKQIKRNID